MQDTDERTFASGTDVSQYADTGGCPAYTALGDTDDIMALLAFTGEWTNIASDVVHVSVYHAYDAIVHKEYEDECVERDNVLLVPESVARAAWFDAIETFLDAGVDEQKYQLVEARNIAAELGWGRTRDADWEDDNCETNTTVIAARDVTVSAPPADD